MSLLTKLPKHLILKIVYINQIPYPLSNQSSAQKSRFSYLYIKNTFLSGTFSIFNYPQLICQLCLTMKKDIYNLSTA